jgi:transposase
MSLTDVSLTCQLDWKTCKDIDLYYLERDLPGPDLSKVTRLAIDEIAIAKGHRYLSILRDFDTGLIVATFEGRGKDDLELALNTLGPEFCRKITHISLDLWDPYIAAFQSCCPQAALVFDKFHVIKKVSEALDLTRRREFAQATPVERVAMKHQRFVILRRNETLDADERETLTALLEKNTELEKAYLLKEQLTHIFADETSAFEQQQSRLKVWMQNAFDSGNEYFQKAANTIGNYLYGILNYFRYRMTNAICEGFNTKIAVLKRRAFGFRDMKYFVLKIVQQSYRRLS